MGIPEEECPLHDFAVSRWYMKAGRLYISIFSFIFLSLFFAYSSHANPLDNWVAVTSPSDNWFYGMTYGNGTFVTVGAFGAILTSPDGVAWTPQKFRHTNHLYGAGFGNNTFVAVGAVDTILTSRDNGVTWTLRKSPKGYPVFEELCGVAYGNGKFVVVGADGRILISSDNGVTWVDPFWPYWSPTANWLFGAAYGNGTYVSVGAYGTVLTSSDAISWYPETSGTSLHLMSAAYGNGTFVAVGESGTILSSIDGVNWSPQISGTTAWLRGVAYANGYFVAVGDTGTILTSPDGMNWTPPPYPFDNNYDLEALAYDTNQSAFAAVGGYGIIMLDGCTGADGCNITLNKDTAVATPLNNQTNCTYMVSPAYKSFKYNGGSLSIKVSATGQDCPAPLVTINDAWLNQPGAASWKKNTGKVKIVVQKNTSSQGRTGVVSIGGNVLLTIEEYGATCRLDALSPSSEKLTDATGAGSFNLVVSSQDCAWNTTTTSSWIHLDTLAGTGDGTATFHIDANTTGKNRIGKITASLAAAPTKQKAFSVRQSK
jgi:photosystem II stability/assembly factor-like uncharacterized protein